MNSRQFITIIIAISLTVSACGVARKASVPVNSPDNVPVMTSVVSTSEMSSIQERLFSAHSQWEGTPYVLGGKGSDGVDCSSFTQIVFDDFFDISLPRNTREQLQSGEGIRRRSIRPGDLIFFRTGRSTLHVGIAMERGDFLHASVSRGVMISNLSEPYWAGRYLGARRLLD